MLNIFSKRRKENQGQDSEQGSWLSQILIYFSYCWENLFNINPNLQRKNISLKFSYVFNYVHRSVGAFVYVKCFLPQDCEFDYQMIQKLGQLQQTGYLLISSVVEHGLTVNFPCTSTSLDLFHTLEKICSTWILRYIE